MGLRRQAHVACAESGGALGYRGVCAGGAAVHLGRDDLRARDGAQPRGRLVAHARHSRNRACPDAAGCLPRERVSMRVASAKAQSLRDKLDVHKPALAMAAHNPLAAKLAANAGFGAIWGSGFELSASYAVPDANILSMGVHLEMMRAIGEVQDAPVIADIDTGSGNAVNVAYVVPRYVAAGVAAVVIEDKTFPKDSSLRAGGRQELVPTAEFQGKLAAAKAAAGDVLVVARTEALIAGLGEAEALRRGAAYAEAGADAVLIHSKQKTPGEILSFCRA